MEKFTLVKSAKIHETSSKAELNQTQKQQRAQMTKEQIIAEFRLFQVTGMILELNERAEAKNEHFIAVIWAVFEAPNKERF